MTSTLQDFIEPILDGGWVMLPLLILGIMIYGLGSRMILTLLPLRSRKHGDNDVRAWISHPEHARRQIKEILRYADHPGASRDDIRARFEEIRLGEIPRINTAITVLNV